MNSRVPEYGWLDDEPYGVRVQGANPGEVMVDHCRVKAGPHVRPPAGGRIIIHFFEVPYAGVQDRRASTIAVIREATTSTAAITPSERTRLISAPPPHPSRWSVDEDHSTDG